jgi:vacuolar protein sorting-associated protein 35
MGAVRSGISTWVTTKLSSTSWKTGQKGKKLSRLEIFDMEEQDRLLEASTLVVREQSYFMKKAIEQENIRDALKYASNMVGELRSAVLSPRFYYELYMQILQEIQSNLYLFFRDSKKHGKPLSDLYEIVQHAGNILPRLYLLITVGVCYMESTETTPTTTSSSLQFSPIEILYDMVELCKGVQNPTRGLFLRYFLLQMTKDKLNRIGSIERVCDYLLMNFSESTRLWGRLLPSSSDGCARKERERYDMRLLVGTSLVGISQLEGIDKRFYVEKILPRIIDQVIECNKTGDCMATQYILDCTVQIFPDEFHYESLQLLLSTCSQIDNVDLRPILINLMNRLGGSSVIGSDGEIFSLFRNYLEKIMIRSKSSSLSSILELYKSFLNLTLSIGGPLMTDRVSGILTMTIAALDKYVESTTTDDDSEAWLEPVLSIIESVLGNIDIVAVFSGSCGVQFNLLVKSSIPSVFSANVADVIISSLLERYETDRTEVRVDLTCFTRLLDLIASTNNQFNLSKLLRCLLHSDPSTESFLESVQLVMSFTNDKQTNLLASLCIDHIWMNKQGVKKVFQVLHGITQKVDIWLTGCEMAVRCELWAIAIEFLTQAVLAATEDEGRSSSYDLIIGFINKLKKNNHLLNAGLDKITLRILQLKNSSAFLNKYDQALFVISCSHLFPNEPHHELECLQKSIRLTESMTQSSTKTMKLYIMVLNRYIDIFIRDREKNVSANQIECLVALCSELSAFSEGERNRFLEDTIRYYEIVSE